MSDRDAITLTHRHRHIIVEESSLVTCHILHMEKKEKADLFRQKKAIKSSVQAVSVSCFELSKVNDSNYKRRANQ